MFYTFASNLRYNFNEFTLNADCKVFNINKKITLLKEEKIHMLITKK